MNKIDLEKLKKVDMITVDRNSLVDISQVSIKNNGTQIDRMREIFSQIKNPYVYKSGCWVVGVGFSGTTTTLEDKMKCLLS